MRRKRSPRINPKLALSRMLKRKEPRCWYCMRLVDRSNASVEHLIARSIGGDNSRDNLRLACRPCNVRAGNLPLEEKMEMKRAMRAKDR